MHVAITGAAGNLGTKLIAHLQAAPWCTAISGIDPRPLRSEGKFSGFVADLRDPGDDGWIEPVERADAVVHFAAQNPWPDSSWPEAAQSMDMTLNLLQHVGQRPCRFVFASSNHVMGGYKDNPQPRGERLSSATPPLPGTSFFDGFAYRTPTAYGSSKLAGERAVAARANMPGSRMHAINIRIGWVQAGENRPETIGPGGGGHRIGPDDPPPAELERDLTWFRGMWLSNRDFVQLLDKALNTPGDTWPSRAITVAGVSNNAGTRWDLAESRRLLGFEPEDGMALEPSSGQPGQ